MTRVPARVLDADNHYYEPDDCFTRHLERGYRDRSIHVEMGDDGLGHWFLGDRPLVVAPHNVADKQLGPGAMEHLFAGRESVREGGGEVIRPRDYPEFMNREARIRLLDTQGLSGAIMLPTMGLAVEHEFQHDAGALCANYRSFNRWLDEDWGFARDGRLWSVPMVTLLDVDFAVEETKRVAELGAWGVFVKCGPVADRSPADPMFDRFWATAAEIGIKVVLHTDLTEFNTLYAKHWSEDPQRSIFEWSPLQHYFSVGERPISDTLAAMTLHNLFGRFPTLEVVVLELGSFWLGPLLAKLDKVATTGANGKWLCGPLPAKPSEILPQHLHVAPFYEDDFREAITLLGPERVLFGSDFPHPEGLKDPLSIVEKYLGDVTDAELRKIMYENTARVVGLTAP